MKILYNKPGVQRGGSTGGSEADTGAAKGKENKPQITLANKMVTVSSGGKRPMTASVKSAKEKAQDR